MVTELSAPGRNPTPRDARAGPRRAGDRLWQAPLVPFALAVTSGIVADRYLALPPAVTLLVAVAALGLWLGAGSRKGLALAYLGLAAAALGAAYHYVCRNVVAPDDISHHAQPEPRPGCVRGLVETEPILRRGQADDPLRSFPLPDVRAAVVRVTHLREGVEWIPVSGRVRLVSTAALDTLRVGDAIEAVGRLVAPAAPANPGEFDFAGYLRDQGIRALLQVEKTPDAIARTAAGEASPFQAGLAAVRGWGVRTLHDYLPAAQSRVAAALLLGDTTDMPPEEWEAYVRTGVVHVLAISGQHLVILAGFLWWVLHLLGVRRRPGALFVALFLLGYALLTGARPPVMRAAIATGAACGAILLRRPALPANLFALAWLGVALLNPTDLFTTGCQLSFVAVALLTWCVAPWSQSDPDPLEQLLDASRPTWERALRWAGRQVVLSYALTLVLFLGVTPLVAARHHVLTPAVLLIGPPTVVLTSVALLAGFLLLLCAALGLPLVALLAWVTGTSLAGCDALVHAAERWPGMYVHVGDIPSWWLWGFYVGLLAFVLLDALRPYWRSAVLAGCAWLCVGLLAASWRTAPEGLRCTFLAVGHGGCTVLETPDGRTLLYDAGAMRGPEVATQQIAPFLWHRGIRRIDELFLSHADLDHYNGVPALLERFALGQVSISPQFAERPHPGVRRVEEELRRRGIPVRTLSAGTCLAAGAVTLDVLHPPQAGQDGTENARSLVLLVQHADRSLLLTGDLEGPGLERVLELPATPVDVLMAPHHGSRAANGPRLAAWARPRVVVACQGPPRGGVRPPDPYASRGALVLGTWPHGAVTVTLTRAAVVVETFVTGRRVRLEE